MTKYLDKLTFGILTLTFLILLFLCVKSTQLFSCENKKCKEFTHKKKLSEFPKKIFFNSHSYIKFSDQNFLHDPDCQCDGHWIAYKSGECLWHFYKIYGVNPYPQDYEAYLYSFDVYK